MYSGYWQAAPIRYHISNLLYKKYNSESDYVSFFANQSSCHAGYVHSIGYYPLSVLMYLLKESGNPLSSDPDLSF